MPREQMNLTNLLELQNKVKKDPYGYYDDFLQAYVHFKSCIDLFELEPNQAHKSLQQLILFIAYVTPCYPDDLSSVPGLFRSLLLRHKNNMHPALRMSLCKALTFYRNRNIVNSKFILEVFFDLCTCQDKLLRRSIKKLIKSDIKTLNKKHRDFALNSELQSIVFSKLKVSSVSVAKVALNVLVEMFRKKIWKEAKVVNNIANCLFSSHPVMMVKALTFFVKRTDDGEIDIPDSDSEQSDHEEKKQKHEKQLKSLLQANRITKKTKRKARKIERAKRMLKKEEKEETTVVNLPALDLIYDPQSLAERLLKLLIGYNGKFHVKLMIMDLISRLVGVHQLVLLNFYPYIQRYLHANQRDVTKCLLFAAQAIHADVPGDVIEKLIQTICYNFITDQNADEVMAVGLNTVREILSRNPTSLDLNPDLVDDLVQFKRHRNKGVVTASRSIIQLLKDVNPGILKSKDRGKPSEHMAEALSKSKGIIAGADVLIREGKGEENDDETAGLVKDVNYEDLKDDDVVGNSEEEESEEEEEEEEELEGDDDADGAEDSDSDDKDDKSVESKKLEDSEGLELVARSEDGKIATTEDLLKSRILTDEDFKKIKVEQLRKKMQFASKAKKRKLVQAGKKGGKKLKRDEMEPEIDSDDLEQESSESEHELPTYEAIAKVNMKRRHDKDAKMSSMLAGREDREKFGRPQKRQNPHASTTDFEKSKKKNFMMLRHKTKSTSRRRSFVERQLKLKTSLKRRYRK